MNLIISLRLIFEAIKKAIRLMGIQVSCFLRKKNWSPMVELASESDDMAIKKMPIKVKSKTEMMRGDFLVTRV